MSALVALTLVVPLLLAAEDECYFVSNTRIVVLPDCDFSPEALAPLEEAEPPPPPGRIEPPPRGAAVRPTFQRGSRYERRRASEDG